MKKFIITSVFTGLTVMLAMPTQAANSSKKEALGVGSGALLGGAVAGPPGVVVGAAVGALFGDRAHRKDLKLTALSEGVEQRDERLGALSGSLAAERQANDALRAELKVLDDSGVREFYALLSRGIEIDLPFRTDDTTIEAQWQQRMTEIAGLLAETPGLAVQIDGYADPRGSTDYNAALSLKRAEAVRALLAGAGVDQSRMVTYGHGEPLSIDPAEPVDADQLALQRKVTVTFYRSDDGTDVAQLID